MFDVTRKSFQLLKSSAWGPPAIRTAPEFRFVTWHPDGERVTFTGADGNLYLDAADGSGEAERLTTGDADAQSSRRIQIPTSWSPDGRTLVFTQRLGSAASVHRDIWSLTLGDPAACRTPVRGGVPPTSRPRRSCLTVATSRISPISRARPEVYVQPFPGPGRRELVST